MKKTFILISAALIALVSCNKSQTVVEPVAPGELSMKAAISGMTKAGELYGPSFDDKGYAMYVSASQYSVAGGSENPLFFNDQLFMNKTTPSVDPTWHHYETEASESASPLYWPVGGSRIDFLAYALPKGKKTSIPAPVFNSSVAAQDFTITDWDTYANQVDLLYAAANGQTSKVNGVDPFIRMNFAHAQALLIFNVSINQASSGLVVNDISFVNDDYVSQRQRELTGWTSGSYVAGDVKAYDACTVPEPDQITLLTKGTFFVDNQRNLLEPAWSYSVTEGEGVHEGVAGVVKANWKMPDFASTPEVSACNIESPAIVSAVKYGTALTSEAYVQLGETLLVPEQDAKNFVITYTVGGNTLQYKYNVPRKVWKAGSKYVYNLDINLNEIVITETVADFVRVADTPVIE